jgi:transcriptional regulator with PAS, ATPase and Fis domain
VKKLQKEFFAQAIHNNSIRKDFQFVVINCGALPESLLESELFGYEEGSFTGARKGGKPGLFELAHRGTLFFDEIGEMPISLQSRLLRVLQKEKL